MDSKVIDQKGQASLLPGNILSSLASGSRTKGDSAVLRISSDGTIKGTATRVSEGTRHRYQQHREIGFWGVRENIGRHIEQRLGGL